MPGGLLRTDLDTAGFQVTVGSGVSERERELFAAGEYQDYLYVHGMGVETAEALAEYWHRQVRHEMGIADEEPEEMPCCSARSTTGRAISFGYPACLNLEDQAKLFELLQPEEIGLELSEEFMLVPECRRAPSSSTTLRRSISTCADRRAL